MVFLLEEAVCIERGGGQFGFFCLGGLVFLENFGLDEGGF
jgi:hypothetical protein